MIMPTHSTFEIRPPTSTTRRANNNDRTPSGHVALLGGGQRFTITSTFCIQPSFFPFVRALSLMIFSSCGAYLNVPSPSTLPFPFSTPFSLARLPYRRPLLLPFPFQPLSSLSTDTRTHSLTMYNIVPHTNTMAVAHVPRYKIGLWPATDSALSMSDFFGRFTISDRAPHGAPKTSGFASFQSGAFRTR